MNDLFIVILTLIFFTLIGKVSIRTFGFLRHYTDLEIMPFSFGLGSALCAFQLYIYSRIHINWSIYSLLIPWVLLLITAFIRNKNTFSFRTKISKKLGIAEYVLIILITILVGFVGFESILRPLSAWDGWASWLLKAKIFYTDGAIYPNVLQYVQSDYPLIVSLIGTYIYILLGKVNDTLVLLFFFACYLMTALTCFTQITKRVNFRRGLLFTFLLLSLQNLIRHGGRFEAGYADLPLALYIFLSSILFFEYIKKKDKMVFILLNIFLGITSLIKNEGLVFSIIVELLSIYSLVKTKKLRYTIFSLFWLVPVSDWFLFKQIYNVPLNFLLVDLHSHVHLDKLFLIVMEVSKEFFNIQNWNMLWITFFISFVLSIINRSKKYLIFYILIILQLCIYILIFLISPIDPVIHVKNIIDRLFIHVAPLAVFAIGISNYEKSE